METTSNGLAFPEALIPLQSSLLSAQIRKETAEAELAEIRLAEAKDKERDRLVRPGKTRFLPINGIILGQQADAWLDALEHWERRDPGQEVFITINSPGGSITDGLAIYDTLMRMRRNGHRVITRGQGLVASMAGVLLQAGEERIMDARAKLLIHEGSTTFSGDRTLTRAEQEDLRTFQDMLIGDILDILAERSNLSRDEIEEKWHRRDWYLTAQEALDLGFVDRVE